LIFKDKSHTLMTKALRLVARAAVEEGEQTSHRRVIQVLGKLETNYLERERAALLGAIRRASDEKRPGEEIEDLMRKKSVADRRIAQLKPSLKGSELGD
jgi:hypothetical protein